MPSRFRPTTSRTSRRKALAGGVATSVALAAGAGAQDAGAFVGTWGGVLLAGSQRLRLRFEIAPSDEGLAVTLTSLDQQSPPLPASEVVVEGAMITARFPQIRGAFSGALSDDGRIAGTWTQGGSLPLTLERDPDFNVLASPTSPLTQDRLAELRAAAGSPALAAMARGRGGAAVAFVDGVRQAGEDAPATLEDIWHLGSITKSMTATLAAILVEQGALAWETTVGEALADAAPEMRAEYRDATLQHLLSHRAGLQANIPITALLRYPLEDADPRESRRAYAAQALAQEPAGPMGESFLYSNSGFVLAGAMIEARLGQPWETAIAERLFAPLGLASAGFGAPGTSGALDQPVGHSAGLLGALGLGRRRAAHPPGKGRTDNPAVLGPAGRVHMRLADLLVFLEAHRDGAGLLSEASWERLHVPPFGGDYALGLVVRPDGTLWHNGSNTIWYAEILIDRSRGIVAAAASNDGVLASSSPAVGATLLEAAEAVLA